MSNQKNVAYEELFAVLDGQDTPELDTPGLIASALDYLEEVLSSDAVPKEGTREHKRTVDAYSALHEVISDRLNGVANMRYVTGYYGASFSLGQRLHLPDSCPRELWLSQLACIRHLVETDFFVLPDRFVRIHATYRTEEKLLRVATQEVIRLTRDDMETDEERTAFDRLVALDETGCDTCHPRLVQYVQPNPEPIEAFHARKEHQIADFSRMLGPNHPIVKDLQQEVANYAETIHAMRAKATELAATKRDDLPITALAQ